MMKLAHPLWRRLPLLAAVLVGGYWTIGSTIAHVVSGYDPALAHGLEPGDGQITAAYAQQLFVADLNTDPKSKASALARAALRQDATAAQALNVLGLQAQLAGRSDAARRYFSYSLALSRRELQARLWAIEDAVKRGDIHGALRSYDVALRTSDAGSGVLFPTLLGALSEPRVRVAILRLLRANPPWRNDFLSYASLHTQDPQSFVVFLGSARNAGIPVSQTVLANAVNALARRGLWNEAWSFYVSYRPGSRRDGARDPKFSYLPATPTYFDWSTAQYPGVSASLVPGANTGTFEFAAAPSTGGTVLMQNELLPSGRYTISGSSAQISQPLDSLPYWSVSCIGGQELTRVTVPASSIANGRYSGDFEVPANCPVQSVSLILRPSNRPEGSVGQILEFHLQGAKK